MSPDPLLESYRSRLGTQAFLSFIEGAKYINGAGAETKYVVEAAKRHEREALAEFDGTVGKKGAGDE